MFFILFFVWLVFVFYLCLACLSGRCGVGWGKIDHPSFYKELMYGSEKKDPFLKSKVVGHYKSTHPPHKSTHSKKIFAIFLLPIKNISDTMIVMSKEIDQPRLGKIGNYILEGLTEEEACILSDASYSDLVTLKENNEAIRDYIAKTKINFKYNHLKELQTKKSEKISQWLLERLRPEDFYIGARSRTPQTINVIGTIIQQIQNDNTTHLISRTREDRLQSGTESNQDSTGPTRVIEVLN